MVSIGVAIFLIIQFCLLIKKSISGLWERMRGNNKQTIKGKEGGKRRETAASGQRASTEIRDSHEGCSEKGQRRRKKTRKKWRREKEREKTENKTQAPHFCLVTSIREGNKKTQTEQRQAKTSRNEGDER